MHLQFRYAFLIYTVLECQMQFPFGNLLYFIKHILICLFSALFRYRIISFHNTSQQNYLHLNICTISGFFLLLLLACISQIKFPFLTKESLFFLGLILSYTAASVSRQLLLPCLATPINSYIKKKKGIFACLGRFPK